MKDLGFDTKALHAGRGMQEQTGSVAVPLYSSATFEYGSAEDLEGAFAGTVQGHVYSRNSNPTVAVFEARIAALENGIGAVGCASGMAALNAVFLSLVRPGDVVAAGNGLFGGTLRFFGDILEKFGARVTYFDPTSAADLKSVIDEKTKVVFIESLSNPGLQIPDFSGLQSVCTEHNLPLIVDNTLPSPALFHPKSVKAAIVVHSATKFITGNGTVIGGVFIDTGSYDWSNYTDDSVRKSVDRFGSEFGFLAHARQVFYRNMGGCLSPFNAFIHLLGLESLGLRMERHCGNALELAEVLSKQDAIHEVNYPGLASSLSKPRADQYFNGRAGGLLTIRLGSKDRCFEFLRRLKIAKIAANLGDAKTLVIHPASTIYRNCRPQEIEDSGVTEDLVRISVGIETIDDLKWDFLQALETA